MAENDQSQWKMPRPRIGDPIVFSTDIHGFSNPSFGWVASEPGDATIRCIVLTPNGSLLTRTSVHHRDDPGLYGDNGWAETGVWDFSPFALAVYKLAAQQQETEKQADREAASSAINKLKEKAGGRI